MKWLFHYQYSIKKVVVDNALWQITVEENNKPPINIAVLKTDPNFLKIAIGGNLNPKQVQELSKITSLVDATLIEELKIELARLGIEFKGLTHPLSAVYLSYTMALDDTLTQLSFIQTCLRIKHAWSLYDNVVIRYCKLHNMTNLLNRDYILDAN